MTNTKAALIASLTTVKTERKTYSVRMESNTYDAIEDLAAKTGKNLNEVINLLIEIGLVEVKTGEPA